MKAAVSWLREFTAIPEDPRTIATRLSACGFAVDGIEGDVIDFEVTANRPDCLSVYGLAREAATAFDLPLAPLAASDAGSGAAQGASAPAGAAVRVSIGDPGCGRYTLGLADVRIGPSPAWLADRLTAAGVRPINNVVDVSNYVMLEMGHPTHAFDARTLAGDEIRVRRARAAERLTTLDGQNRALDETMLVIADRDRAIAVAGVMGGAATEVSAGTTRIAIESAWFQPASVRATGKRLGLKSEASARFERGADLSAPPRALHRVLALLEQIGAGRASGFVIDLFPRPADPRRVTLARAHVTRLLGDTVPDRDIERLLRHLGFDLSARDGGWTVTVPSFRIDVQREVDLIEEIGRHWGFDRIPPSFPALRTMPRPTGPVWLRERTVRRLLAAAGLQEAVTFTFIEDAAAAPFAHESSTLAAIANPLSEKFATLRPSLMPGLVDALVYNRRRESDHVRLFEIGTVFTPDGEATHAAWILTGARGDHWSQTEAALDLFDATGVADLVAGAFGATIDARAIDRAGFVRGRTAELVVAGSLTPVVLGGIGQVAGDVLSARGLGASGAVVAGWIDLAALGQAGSLAPRAIGSLPRFPSIVRDLAIIVDDRLPAADVRGTIRAHAPATLVSVREFDRYQGKGVPTGQVSLALRLTFRHADRTLTDSEIQQAVDGIVAALTRAHGAVLRGGAGNG